MEHNVIVEMMEQRWGDHFSPREWAREVGLEGQLQPFAESLVSAAGLSIAVRSLLGAALTRPGAVAEEDTRETVAVLEGTILTAFHAGYLWRVQMEEEQPHVRDARGVPVDDDGIPES